MSNLVDHARTELERCGQFAEDPAYAQSLVCAVAALATYGHSGGSMFVAQEQLAALLRFENLSPLTDDPDEWSDVTEQSGVTLYQNRRNSNAFSVDAGATYYVLEEAPRVMHVSAPANVTAVPCDPAPAIVVP
jgi:hypothetical protein